MERDDNTRLRITPWPQVALPHPGQDRGFPFAYHPEADALVPDWEARERGPSPAPPLTEELYLKLAALDPDNVDELVEFVSIYGELDMRGKYSVGGPPTSLWMFPTTGVDDEQVELVDALERAVTATGGFHGFGDTLTEVRYAIWYMRDLIAARRALDGEIDNVHHTWEAPFWRRWKQLDSPPWTAEGPATALSVAMSEGLTPYSPHLRTFFPGDEPVPLWSSEVGTWNVCCLELFNHIVEDARYKTCANQTCGRLFVRQEGRTVHGQHRTRGIKYCSAYCARAQAQRDYRRRKHQ